MQVSLRCPLPLIVSEPAVTARARSRLKAANDLVPSGKSIAGTHVPNHRFFAIRRRPRDGVVRTGELNVGTVVKGHDCSVVRSDHVEPLAGARQSKRVIAAKNVGAAAGAVQSRCLTGTNKRRSRPFKHQTVAKFLVSEAPLVTNAELTAHFTALGRPAVIDKLATSTGITKRFHVPDDWVTSDLALPAAKEALKRAGREPEDVDLIILGTTSPDYITPDTAVVLQHKLGAKNAGTFDVGCACAAFPPMIAIGSGLITANAAIKTILVIAVDMIYRLTDPNDPGCFLWSDGAGAVVLERGSLQGFIGAAFQADGAYASGWGILAGGTFEAASIDAVKAGRTQMRREKGNYPATVNEDGWPRLFKRLAAENGFTADDVDQLLFTQVSKPSIVIAAERCGVPMEKCHTIMEKYGYTGSSCIPVAWTTPLNTAKSDGVISSS